jgi:hypothetical protein
MAMTAAMVIMCGVAYFLDSKQIMIPKAPQRVEDIETNEKKPDHQDEL